MYKYAIILISSKNELTECLKLTRSTKVGANEANPWFQSAGIGTGLARGDVAPPVVWWFGHSPGKFLQLNVEICAF